MDKNSIDTAFARGIISNMRMDDHEKNLKKIFADFVGVNLIDDKEARDIISKISSDLAKELRKEDEIMFSRFSILISNEIARNMSQFNKISNKSQ